MFGNSKKTVNYTGEMETIIGKNTIITGNISGKGTFRIDGQLEGDINTDGNVLVGDDGKVTAHVTAVNANIAGTVYGNVEITEKLELMPTAKIFGDIKVGTLIIGEGAIFKGACEMQHGMEEPVGKEKSNGRVK